MIYRMPLFVALAAAVLALVSVARAQDSDDSHPSRFRKNTKVRGTGKRVVHEDGKAVIYKQKNVVDFDDSLVEGDVKNPSEFYFTVRPTTPTKNLIERRKNFHKEMLRDTVMIR